MKIDRCNMLAEVDQNGEPFAFSTPSETGTWVAFKSVEALITYLEDKNTELRKLLADFYDYGTKAAGVTPELVRDKEAFSQFLEGCEARKEDLARRARELLDPMPPPPSDSPSKDAKDAARYRVLREHWFAMRTMQDRNTARGTVIHHILNAGDLESLDAALDKGTTEGSR